MLCDSRLSIVAGRWSVMSRERSAPCRKHRFYASVTQQQQQPQPRSMVDFDSSFRSINWTTHWQRERCTSCVRVGWIDHIDQEHTIIVTADRFVADHTNTVSTLLLHKNLYFSANITQCFAFRGFDFAVNAVFYCRSTAVCSDFYWLHRAMICL